MVKYVKSDLIERFEFSDRDIVKIRAKFNKRGCLDRKDPVFLRTHRFYLMIFGLARMVGKNYSVTDIEKCVNQILDNRLNSKEFLGSMIDKCEACIKGYSNLDKPITENSLRELNIILSKNSMEFDQNGIEVSNGETAMDYLASVIGRKSLKIIIEEYNNRSSRSFVSFIDNLGEFSRDIIKNKCFYRCEIETLLLFINLEFAKRFNYEIIFTNSDRDLFNALLRYHRDADFIQLFRGFILSEISKDIL